MAELHIVLVNPEIHWNTGNVGRTCLAVGAQLHLVEPLGFSLEARELKRAGLDYWPHVAPRLWRDWDSLEVALPALGQAHFFATAAARSFWAVRYPRPSVLIFGRESDGLPAAVLDRHRDATVRLPMDGTVVRSLNLSTAAAVAAYEVRRQWDAG